MQDKIERITMSASQLAAHLGVSRTTAYLLMKTEGFPSFYIGKRALVTKEALSKWIEEQQGKKPVEL